MIALRWGLWIATCVCIGTVVHTGLANGVLLLAIIFLAAFVATFRAVRDAVLPLLGVAVATEAADCDGPCCLVDHTDAVDGEQDR